MLEEIDGDLLAVTLAPNASGRIDKALAEATEGLSRARIRALMADGAVTLDGREVTDPYEKAKVGAAYEILVPPPEPADPQPEAISLTILYEDEHLIVIDKAPGMEQPFARRATASMDLAKTTRFRVHLVRDVGTWDLWDRLEAGT